MNKSKQGILLSLIIILVCSITPATAIQNMQTNTNGEISDWDAYIKGVEYALDVMGGQEPTELTPQQDEYVEAHLVRIEARGENVLDQLQAYLTYINKELSEYEVTPTNTRNMPKSATNLGATATNPTNSQKDMKKELKEQGIVVQTATYEYDNLSSAVNGENGENPTLDKNRVIVQFKDGMYYVYADLININGNEISIETPEKNKTWSEPEFKKYHSADGKINIIIIPEDCGREDTLDLIYQIQRKDLTKSINYCLWGIGLLGVVGTAGVALITTGVVKCCDPSSKTELKNIVISDIEEKGEASALVPKQSIAFEEVEKSPVLKKKKYSACLIISGIIILGGCGGGVPGLWYLKSIREEEKENLNKWG
jgi:hypothetical protein